MFNARVPYSTRTLFMLVLLYATIQAVGQEYKVVRDLHLWTGINIEKTFARDWTISIGEEIQIDYEMEYAYISDWIDGRLKYLDTWFK